MAVNGTLKNALTFFALAATLACGLAFLPKRTTPPLETVVAPDSVRSQPKEVLVHAPLIKTPAAETVCRPLPGQIATAPFMPPAPQFTEIAQDTYEALSPAYTALVSAGDGLRYSVQDGHGAVNELRLNLKSVKRGTLVVFDREAELSRGETPDVPVRKGDAALCFYRGASLEECYEPRGDGVEQSFVVDSAAGSAGALEFECSLHTAGLNPLPPRNGLSGGIFFRDGKGKIAARYGRIMVRDSGKKVATLEPRLSDDGASICFAVPHEWLEQAQFPIVVDPLVGSDFAVSADNPTGVAQPTVSAGTGNYLVAWTDYSNGPAAPVIAATVVLQSGTFSKAFVVSGATAAPLPWHYQRIESAFDGLNWLVVWADLRAAQPGIYGAIVTSTGTVVGTGDFLIGATTGKLEELPLVRFDGANYTVAWMDSPQTGVAGSSQIYVTHVATTGVTSSVQSIKSNLSAVNQYLEYLAAQPGGDTLLLYEEIGEIPVTHRSVRVAANLTVRDPGGTILFTEDISASPRGYGRPIGAVFTSGEWQILSTYDQTTDSAVYLTHLSTAGAVTPPSGIFATMGVGPTGLHEPGFSQLIDSYAPAFPGAAEWLFLRNEKVSGTVYHILGKRVKFDGSDLDPQPFQIDSAKQGILRSSVASQGASTFLTAWVDGRKGASQPADALNIDAAFIDASAPGSAGIPLHAVATGSPLIGEAPLTVSFDSSQSSGLTGSSTISWDFGDGSKSTLVSPSHIFKGNGTFPVQLTITDGGYSVYDIVVVTVGSGGNGQFGIPLQNTPPIVPGLVIGALSIKLDFANSNADTVTLSGRFDVSSFKDGLTGLQPTVQIGSVSFELNALDANGQSVSAATSVQTLAFSINSNTNGFAFSAANGNLRNELATLGLVNANYAIKDGLVAIPVTIGIGKLSQTFSVDAQYHATKNVSGIATFNFGSAGKPVSGSFIVNSCSVSESGKSHTYMIKGQLLKPGSYTFKSAESDAFIGLYKAAIDGGRIFDNKGVKTITNARVKSGLKKFSINPVTGGFLMQLFRVPAIVSDGGTGLPLAKSGAAITDAQLNLSFEFNLTSGDSFNAGTYMNLFRANAASRSWKLR